MDIREHTRNPAAGRGERRETMNQCVIGIDIGSSGTKTIAVDRDGKILAIGPSPEEVERILEKMLK